LLIMSDEAHRSQYGIFVGQHVPIVADGVANRFY